MFVCLTGYFLPLEKFHTVKQLYFDCIVIPHKFLRPCTHRKFINTGVKCLITDSIHLLIKTRLQVFSIECFMISTCFNVCMSLYSIFSQGQTNTKLKLLIGQSKKNRIRFVVWNRKMLNSRKKSQSYRTSNSVLYTVIFDKYDKLYTICIAV